MPPAEGVVDGRYDEECRQLRLSVEALGVAIVVIGGNRGHGFSMDMPASLSAAIPDTLRALALDIEADLKRKQSPPKEPARVRCPVCQATFKAFRLTGVGPNRVRHVAQENDVAVCGACGSFLRYQANDSVRLMTQDEVAELPEDYIRVLVRMRREAQEQQRGD